MEDSRIFHSIQLNVTYKLSFNANQLNEHLVKDTVTQAFQQYAELEVKIEGIRFLKDDGIVLILISAPNERVVREVDGMFPFQNIQFVKKWIHHAGKQSIAILRNPPPRVTPDYVQGILEDTEGINAEVSQDGNNIKVVLDNATDLPYLVSKTFTLKKTPVHFEELELPAPEEGSMRVIDDELQVDEEINSYGQVKVVNQEAPPPHDFSGIRSYNRSPVHSYSSSPRIPPSLHVAGGRGKAVEVTSEYRSGKELEKQLQGRFDEELYKINEIFVDGATACFTFTSEQGIIALQNKPLSILNGYPIECRIVSLEYFAEFKKRLSEKEILIIRGLPSNMPEAKVKVSLKRRLGFEGHIIKDCIIKGTEAHITFEDNKSVRQLVSNPPDNSELLGHPITYSTGPPPSPKPVDPRPHVVVENLPNIDEIDEDLISFMNKTTNSSVASCEIKNGTGYLYYHNPEDAKRVVQAPPSSSFYGQKLKVTLKHSESVPSDMSDYKSNLEPLPVQRINTSPAAMKRPVAKPRSLTDLIIVENIPEEEDESHLLVYLNLLCGVKCSISERKGVGAAVIKFNDKIDVKLLKEKSLSCLFGKDQVQLVMESYRPNSAPLNEASHNLTDNIIVSGLSPGSQNWMLKAYFNQFGLKCDDPQMTDGGTSAIVKLDTKADVSLLQQSIEISPYPGQRLSVEPYNPPDAYDGAPVTNSRSRCSGLSSFIVVKEIPLNTADYGIKLYIDRLHGSQVCMDTQFNPEAGIAVIELKESVDVKELRRKAMKEPFPNGKVVLNIDVWKPSTSVLIESLTSDAVPRHVIEIFCEQFGDVVQLDETKRGYIVTFSTRESQQKIFSPLRIHSVGKHEFLVEEYNPLLKPVRPPSPPPPIIPPPIIPPPIPPRAVYSWPSYRKTISRESRDYYMHYTKEINEKLIEGKLRVSANSLEVEPLAGANDIDDWDVQVRRVIDEYSQNFESAEIKVPTEVQKKAIDYIEGLINDHPDLHYSFHPPALIKMCGHSASIRKASTELEKMTQEEIQITLQLEKHPRYIEYILKFAKDDINLVHPPVKIEYEKERRPGCVTVHGVKKSLDKVEDLAEKKIRDAFTETIPLTTSANSLLQSRDGRAKISKALGPTEHSVLYVFEKTDTHHDFQAQICILSPESVACAAAKRCISSLIVEEKLALSLDEAALCTSQEWGTICTKLTAQYFVKIITVANEFILLTGEDKIINAVMDEIKQFLQTQNAVTDKLAVKSTVWQIIGDGHKCKEIEKTAKKQKVKLTFPAKAGPGQGEVIILLKGEAKAVSHMKAQLLMLVNEVKEKQLVISHKVGLKKLIDSGMVKLHCNGIEANNDVKISFQVEEVSDRLFAPKGKAALANAPHCVIGATSPNGIKIQIYTGDPAIKRADALAIFVCDATTVDDPLMASLAAVGGAEVRSTIEAFTARQRLIDATVHKCATVGNLDYAEVYHVVLPKYSSKSPKLGEIIDASLHALFEKVSSRVRDVIIAPLTGPPHKYPVELCAQSLLNYFSSASFGIYNDISVGIFIEKDRDKVVFHKKLQELRYSVHHFDDSSKRGSGGGTSLKIQLINGDVTKAPADVIVNSTSIDMRHDANTISKAIHKAAGDDLKRACQNLKDQGVLLKDGFVVSTPASGLLRCNKIIHAHAPGKSKNRRPTDKETSTLKRVVSNCLTTADEERESSIAFAAFCLGIGGFTVEESAEPTLEAIKEFALTKPSHLKEVSIYALDKALFPHYRDYFSTYFASDATVTPLDPSKGPDGVSVTLRPVAIPRQRTTTTVGGLAGQKTFEVSFLIHGTVAEKLSQAEKDVYKFIEDLIVDDMVDLGDMTNLFSQSDHESILKFASDQEVEINFQARLNRVLVSGEERAVEKVCNDIQRRIMNLNSLLHELHMFEWLVINRDGTEEPYKVEQAKQLEVAHQRKEEFVKLEIDGIKCIVNLRMMEETEDISRVTKPVTRRRKVHHDYPATWDLSNIGKVVVTFFDVDEHSDEYTTATKRFNETIGSNVIITRVQRIQNPSEYTRYQSLKTTWSMLHGKGSVNEKELFHGTKRDKVEPICSTGFNRGYAADSNAARYGKGVYFALNASYSMQDKYSQAEKDGSKCILVCSLLVCKVTRGNEKMKVPPPTPENPQILYDTLVEREQNPTIFVAMKDSQAYPKYLIVFKKA